MNNEQYANRLRKDGSNAREANDVNDMLIRHRDSPASGWGSWVAIGLGIFAVQVLIFLLLGFLLLPELNKQLNPPPASNCSYCIAQPGRDGLNIKGDTGKPGTNGTDGRDGTNAVCLGNIANPCPASTVPGPRGEKGDTGNSTIGPPGTPCMQNCTNGKDGVCLQNCTDGAKGNTGDTGADGVCNCTGSLAFGDTNHTSINLGLGGMTCLVPINQSCIGSGVCADWSTCNGTFAFLRSLTTYQLGFPGSGASEFANFGKKLQYSPSLEWLINEFTVYAENIDIAARSSMIIRSAGTADFAFGASVYVAAQNLIQVVSASGNIDITAAAGAIMLKSYSVLAPFTLQSSNGIDSIGPVVRLLGGGQIAAARSVGDNVWITEYGSSLDYITGIVNTENSIRFDDDIVQQTGTVIVSKWADQFLRLGRFVEIGGGLLKSTGNTLILQGDSSTKLLDIQANISNSEPGNPVIFVDPEGVNFYNTPLFDSDGELDIEGNIKVSNGDLLVSGATQAITINNGGNVLTLQGGVGFAGIQISHSSGTVQIGGNLNVGGSITSVGSCCGVPSDMRSKHNVIDVETQNSLERTLKLGVIEWQHKPWFEQARNITHNKVFRGFSAQATREVNPDAITESKQQFGDKKIDDFLMINQIQLIPDAIGSVKALHAMIEKLTAKVEALTATADERTVFGLERKMKQIVTNARADTIELYKRHNDVLKQNAELKSRIIVLENNIAIDKLHRQDATTLFKNQIEIAVSANVKHNNQLLTRSATQSKNVVEKIEIHTRKMEQNEQRIKSMTQKAQRWQASFIKREQKKERDHQIEIQKKKARK